MKKSKVIFIVDNFTDFENNTREVIMAAVSSEIDGVVTSAPLDELVISEDEIVKEVRLGISVRRGEDEFDIEKGKQIAMGKALKEKSCFGKIFVTDKGFINNAVVEAFLRQEMAFFKQNPGKYLAGYDRNKKAYLA